MKSKNYIENELAVLEKQRRELDNVISTKREEIRIKKQEKQTDKNLIVVNDIDVLLKYVEHSGTACNDINFKEYCYEGCPRCVLLDAKLCNWLNPKYDVKVVLNDVEF